MNLKLKLLIVSLVLLVLSFIYVTIILVSPPGILLDIQPSYETLSLPKSFTGPFKQNYILSKSHKLFQNQLKGPESIAYFNGTLLTGSRDGCIYRLDPLNNTLTRVIKLIDNECQTWNQSLCGQPLGIRFDSSGDLYVVEPYFGIFRVKYITTEKPVIEHILTYKDTESLGKQSIFFDDIAIDEFNGDNGGHILYITEMSTKYDLSHFLIAAADSGSGRILRYDINSKKLDIVVDNIWCPNGIDMDEDKQFIVFTETTPRRISKHYIRGAKSGQTVLLLSDMPGEPDNIRKTTRNTYWIALVSARTQLNPRLVDWIQNKPLIQKLWFRSLHLFGNTVQSMGHLFNSLFLTNLGFSIKTGLSDLLVHKLMQNSHGMAIEMNQTGGVVQCLHSPDGAITLLSQVIEIQEQNHTILYLGSYYNNYIAKLILN